jgi:hypothetical protein
MGAVAKAPYTAEKVPIDSTYQASAALATSKPSATNTPPAQACAQRTKVLGT